MIPGIPAGFQRWILILSVPFWIICAIAMMPAYFTVNKSPAYLIGAVLYCLMAVLAIYTGIKTGWLKNMDGATGAARVTGGIVIVLTGTYFLIVAAIASWFVLLMVIVVLIIGFVISASNAGGAAAEAGASGVVSAFGRGTKIQKATAGDKGLIMGGSGLVEISKALLTDDMVLKRDGVIIGQIKQAPFNKDVQYIMDQDGNKVGEISSTIIGERILTDSDGNTVCKFVKGRDGLNIVHP